MKVYFLTLGCRVNQYETDAARRLFLDNGHENADTPEEADVCIVNTCSVTGEADRKSSQMLRRMAKNNPNAVIVAMGCASELKTGEVPSDIVIGTREKNTVVKRVEEFLASGGKGSLDHKTSHVRPEVSKTDEYHDFGTVLSPEGTRAFIKIEDGCNNFCTYCIVPYARGRERSRDFNEIVKELSELASQGYKEVMLLGQNVNSYKGAGGETFADILRAASDFKEFSRVRFMSSHPKDLSDEVIDIMASRPNVEKHLHLAMQSGSNKVLKAMNRPYTIERFQEIVDKFRAKVEGGSLTTDIIVGFPGETDEDFEETLVAVDKAKFDACFTFQYSARPGTKAAAYENQVPSDVVTERFGRLTEYTNRYAEESNKKLVGKTMEVLIEGISKAGDMTFSGRTVTNHLVNFTIPEELGIDPGEDYLEGRLCEVRIDRARPYSVDGILVSLKGEEA